MDTDRAQLFTIGRYIAAQIPGQNQNTEERIPRSDVGTKQRRVVSTE